jgi:outer membrane protein assembly factor BamA
MRVVEVEIAGETAGITPERELGIPIGAPLSRQLVRSALTRLGESGRWADAQIDLVRVEGGVKVVAHLRPRLLVARLEVRGNDVLSDADLLRAIEVGSGAELRPETGGEIARAVERSYAERGFEQTRAQIVVRDTDDPTHKVLIVQIDEGRPTRIARIQFEGEAPPRDSRAAQMLDVSIGDVLDLRRIAGAVRETEARMRERGWLEAALGEPVVRRIDETRVIVSIPSHPGPRYELRIVGFEPLEMGDVAAVLDLEQARLTAATAETVRERVIDFYRKHGFPDATATVRRVRGEEEGSAFLVVSIEAGEQLRVVAMEFPGTRHFDAAFLQGQIESYLLEDLPGSALCAHSAWSRCRSRSPVDTETVDAILNDSRPESRRVPRPLVVDGRQVYYEPTYTEALDHITELLQAEGYLSASVGPARLTRFEGGRAIVEIPVVEGPRTMLHRVVIEGNEVLTRREILESAGLERGQPFSHLSLEHARLQILSLYGEHGHLYARIDPTVRFSGDRTRAEVTLEIVEGVQVRVGPILIEGANQTSEALIRERLALRTGEVYRPSDARRSQERLLELGIFSAVNIAPQDSDLPAPEKPVVVTVTERSWGFVDLSAGFSTGEGLRGGFDFGIRNVLGYAIGINVGIRAAFQFFFVDDEVRRRFEELSTGERLEGRVTLGATLPHLPSLPNWRLSFDTGFYQDNERDFGINRFGGSVSFIWRPLRQFTTSFSPGLERNDVNLFVDEDLDDYLRTNTDPRLERLLRVPAGRSFLAAFGNTVAVDLRDNPFNTTRGFFASLESEYARTLSAEQPDEIIEPFESDFVKSQLTTSGYVPVTDTLVFAAQMQIGRVFHLNDVSKTYPNRAFFLGGVDTMRGYLQDAMIPQDVADTIASDMNQSTIACRQTAAVTPGGDPDACGPVLLPNGVFRGGDSFFLVRTELRFNIPVAEWLWGGVFAELGNLWADPNELNPIDLRPSAGAGLRIETPVGPLAFDFGFLLAPRDVLDEDPWAFHFSIGLF